MKKLMMFAAAMTIVGSAFALDVFDYKASVKNPDPKTIKVKIANDNDELVLTTVTVKYVKSTSLYGYLVTECAACVEGDGAGYLVVANTKDKAPKILPADLLAKVWPANAKVSSKTWTAEGYLFAGCGKVTHPWGTYLTWGTCDYDASSEYLFGVYNRGSSITVDDVTTVTFADAWLDAAGFGKAQLLTTTEAGDACENGSSTTCEKLDSLSGSVIGGMFLCAQSYGEVTLCNPWALTTDVVSGTWSIKRNTKIVAVTPEADYANGLGDTTVDAYVNAAIKKIKAVTFDSVVPGTTAEDFPRITAE